VLGFYTSITNFIARTAAMVPAEKLMWQPTPDMRGFAQHFAHIVDDNNGACSAIAGVTPPPTRTWFRRPAGHGAADRDVKDSGFRVRGEAAQPGN
jgi:hypothetical protein